MWGLGLSGALNACVELVSLYVGAVFSDTSLSKLQGSSVSDTALSKPCLLAGPGDSGSRCMRGQ